MTALHLLWLPPLLSSLFVFVASSIIHMALPWHKSDYSKLPDEGRVLEALRPFAIPPGDYMVPRPSSMQDMKSAEFSDKLKRGPVFVATVYPNGAFSMARNLIFWFLYCGVVGLFAAYIASRALPVGSSGFHVFRLVGAAAFMGYSMALWQMSIWYRRAWGTTVRSTIDGLIYALVTAGTFAWLWPR